MTLDFNKKNISELQIITFDKLPIFQHQIGKKMIKRIKEGHFK